ncbi:AraC family transcriptional regulator [Xylophilus sp. GOD-11R]|uniref:AraC family transcriptional regulator n=1 Tax=Xylophilus sp. GOD-11R TaxID=3089814 RepID=UPI00298C911A|nr:AraC family transcriptional regulator [Xylophilus sp. GOD-11R]WPB58569.1 AraC family transcriptional regulator [Xylophilus sp. GOD-11R]
MTETLLQAARRHADAHADAAGIAPTPIDGLSIVRSHRPSGLIHDIYRPLVCLVLQGAKEVTVGTRTHRLQSGDSLLITADVPTVSRITDATEAAPYVSIVMDLDLSVVSELALQMEPVLPGTGHDAARATTTDAEVAEACGRLMRLVERPESLAILQAQGVRELHYWLLTGKHGPAIRQLGWPESQVRRVARAVALLRAEFDRPLTVERLAATAGMSPSSFHQHFRAVTSLSPLQFQKRLRLIEARRRMIGEGASASAAAFGVGYESVPQFTREYGRMFGLPPARDTEAARRGAEAAA